MMRHTWVPLLLVVSLLSGCVAYKDDVDPAPSDADHGADPASSDGEDASGDDRYAGTVAADVLFEESWSGPRTFDESVPIDRTYDHLRYTWTNSGQQATAAAYTSASGEDMDSGTLASRNGAFTVERTLPGDEGTATIRSLTPVAGSGSVSVIGIDNLRPAKLLGVTWSGQTLHTAGVPGSIGFHVPEGLGEVVVTLSGSGQVAMSLRILDPDGNRVAGISTMTGSDADEAQVTATPGTWSLAFEGTANGSFTATVVALPF